MTIGLRLEIDIVTLRTIVPTLAWPVTDLVAPPVLITVAVQVSLPKTKLTVPVKALLYLILLRAISTQALAIPLADFSKAALDFPDWIPEMKRNPITATATTKSTKKSISNENPF